MKIPTFLVHKGEFFSTPLKTRFLDVSRGVSVTYQNASWNKNSIRVTVGNSLGRRFIFAEKIFFVSKQKFIDFSRS